MTKCLKVLQPKDTLIAIRGGLSLGARIWGDEAAINVPPENRWLALHGFLDNAGSYNKLAPEMLALGASSVVCLDMAGHGKSEWRPTGVYYVFDNVADIVYAADALKWDTFSIIGHSLGGGVAQGVAATCPDRVLRLVSIEALSWWPQDSKQFVSNLRTNIHSRQKGSNLQVFKSLEECADRRSKMNIGGALDIAAAQQLVQRGATWVEKTDQHEGGFRWASDPSLLAPSRVRVDELSCQNILESITCPSVVLFAGDGMWKQAKFIKTRLFTIPWALTVATAHVLTAGWHYISTFGSPLRTDFGKGSSLASKVKFVYVTILRRWLSHRTATFICVPTGGHHPHLTQAPTVARELGKWLTTKGKVLTVTTPATTSSTSSIAADAKID
eukprot:CAMPEP_0179460154 /NCGR_PEP_ID=MMETSP0799-20121207/43299_1 /TAXON_ID=46947 /ORGANISM="Geminigera cryophila, Strain CCMP2564" /LENGTH=385 /DNA_ID=CAMNT_0021262311 /DNA_START=6 /DNA_END=1163 /DNA_ORIENTATION=+